MADKQLVAVEGNTAEVSVHDSPEGVPPGVNPRFLGDIGGIVQGGLEFVGGAVGSLVSGLFNALFGGVDELTLAGLSFALGFGSGFLLIRFL